MRGLLYTDKIDAGKTPRNVSLPRVRLRATFVFRWIRAGLAYTESTSVQC